MNTTSLFIIALVGNNDCHFHSWSIVRLIRQSSLPYFSPVYDTARDLFWNDNEEKIVLQTQNRQDKKRYICFYYNWVSSPANRYVSLPELLSIYIIRFSLQLLDFLVLFYCI